MIVNVFWSFKNGSTFVVELDRVGLCPALLLVLELVAGPFFFLGAALAPFVESCLRGALPPVDLLTVCLVRGILVVGGSFREFSKDFPLRK